MIQGQWRRYKVRRILYWNLYSTRVPGNAVSLYVGAEWLHFFVKTHLALKLPQRAFAR